MYVAMKRPREKSGGAAAEGTVKKPPKKKQKAKVHVAICSPLSIQQCYICVID